MRWTARVGDRIHQVETIRRHGGDLEATVDGRRYALSVTEPQERVYSILEGGVSHEAIVQVRQGRCRVRIGAALFEVVPEEPGRAERSAAARRAGHGSSSGRAEVSAVMPGRVLRVLVKPGQKVAARQGLVVLEAMKMENELAAPREGVVKEVRVEPGRTVETGDLLAVIE